MSASEDCYIKIWNVASLQHKVTPFKTVIKLSLDSLNQLTAAYGFVYYCYYAIGSVYHKFDANRIASTERK